jgi:hypothetical protein
LESEIWKRFYLILTQRSIVKYLIAFLQQLDKSRDLEHADGDGTAAGSSQEEEEDPAPDS